MANNLTGDYEAVLLIRVLKINGLLATLHQKGADEDASPTFPHSETVRVGDPPTITRPDLGQYAEWFNQLLATLDPSRGGSDNGASKFSAYAPPGASRVLHEAYEDVQAARFEIIHPSAVTVRGTARVQLSTPSISLPPGTTSEVTVHVNVRAHYTPDPGTIALPEPVHGEVRVTYSATVKRLENLDPAKNILEIEVSQDDGKIQFHPAAGINLSPFEFSQLLAQIRRVLREGFEPVNVELPADFRFLQFKELNGGQVLALPTQLTEGVGPPAGALGTVTNNFLDADFSIAISKEYVEARLQRTLDEFSQFRLDQPVRIPIPFDGSFTLTTYHVSVTSPPELEWKEGLIDLIIKARATASLAPDYDVTIRQGLTLVLNSSLQSVSLGASNNDLTVSLSGFGTRFLGFVRDRIRDAIIPERDAALHPPPPEVPPESMINDELNRARARLNDALKSFDDFTRAEYGRLDVTPDGLILHGGLFSQFRRPPVVEFEETSDGSAFTALKSWIPGGRIDRFEWSWIMQNMLTPWGDHLEASSDEHRFILPKPLPQPGPFAEVLGDVCLRIHGIQVDQNGFALPFAAGESCSVSTPEVNWRMPAWAETMTVPVWLPDTPADGILEDAIAGHVNVLAHSRPSRDPGTNSLVHFADPRMDKPLDALGQALARSRKGNAPLLIIVVLASGTLTGRRREVEAQLGSLGESFRGRLLLTEDYTGGWRRTFDTERAPSTYLMNARGEFVFEQEGVLDTEALAAALDEHFTSGRAPRARRLSLSASPGERAPRALFTDDRGQQLALRKLRGHPILLYFWQLWSAPSIRELQRLQSLQEKSGERAPVIVAVSGDKDCEVLFEVRRKYKLTFALVHDSDGFIARSYGVYCWPTTVSIGPDGFVDGVQLGIARERRIDAGAE